MLSVNFIKGLIVVAIISVLLVLLKSGYTSIKEIGYREAEYKYLSIIQAEKEQSTKQIDTIEAKSTELASINKALANSLAKDIYTISSNLKGKTLTIINNGECNPSKTFSDSILEINLRTNQAIKDSQK